MAEVNPHPIRRGEIGRIRRTNSPRRRFILRFPAQRIVIAPMPEMQKTPRRHQKFQSRIQLLPHRLPQQTGVGPVAQLSHRRNQRQPASHVVIAQPAWSLFQIRLEMEHCLPELSMPLVRHLSQPLQQRFRFPHHQLWDHFIVKPREQFTVARQVAAIQKRDGEFSVIWIKAIAFRKHPRCRAQLEFQVPQFLRESPDCLFVNFFAVTVGIEKKQINIRIRKEPAAPKTSGRHQREVSRPRFVSRHQIVPQPL